MWTKVQIGLELTEIYLLASASCMLGPHPPHTQFNDLQEAWTSKSSRAYTQCLQEKHGMAGWERGLYWDVSEETWDVEFQGVAYTGTQVTLRSNKLT